VPLNGCFNAERGDFHRFFWLFCANTQRINVILNYEIGEMLQGFEK
jgi:hypothetical protein